MGGKAFHAAWTVNTHRPPTSDDRPDLNRRHARHQDQRLLLNGGRAEWNETRPSGFMCGRWCEGCGRKGTKLHDF